MTELRPFQKQGVKQIYAFKGNALLADEMGLGKTIQALYWVRQVKAMRPVVIVTPAMLKYNWQAEADLHFGIRCSVLEGHSKGKSIHSDIIIINYEILHTWLPSLLKIRPQCVIFDECHYIKNLSAQRTQAAIKLARTASVRSRLALSGTPMTNRPYELWPILHILKPELFPDLNDYAWRYCKPRYSFRGWVYDGAANTKELNTILKREVMIRRLTRDVLPDMPAKIRIYVPFKLTSKAMVEYNHAEKDFLKWLQTKNPAKAARAKRSPALVKVGYLLRLVAKMKRKLVTQWIADFFAEHPKKKLVALTMHTPAIDYQKERFPNHVVIDGRVTGKLRTESVRKFQRHRDTNLCLGNWRAASVGITLTAAQTFVGLDLPFTPGDLMQGEKRIHRIGQHEICRMYYLIAIGTIEEKLMKILRRKSQVLDQILNGEETDEDLSNIFVELLKQVKHEQTQITDKNPAR